MKIMLVLVCAAGAFSQQWDLSTIDKLSAKATESSSVNLDAEKLQSAAKLFLSTENGEHKAQKLVSGMKGIFVRTFEFDRKGAYAPADLDGIHKQLRAPGWSKVVDVKDGNETAEVYFFQNGPELGGLAVIAAEPQELAVVNIVGPVDLTTLGQLGGASWLSKMEKYITSSSNKQNSSGTKKDD